MAQFEFIGEHQGVKWYWAKSSENDVEQYFGMYFWNGEAMIKAEGYIKPVGGKCKEKAKPGGCQLHNLHCGYPKCDQ